MSDTGHCGITPTNAANAVVTTNVCIRTPDGCVQKGVSHQVQTAGVINRTLTIDNAPAPPGSAVVPCPTEVTVANACDIAAAMASATPPDTTLDVDCNGAASKRVHDDCLTAAVIDGFGQLLTEMQKPEFDREFVKLCAPDGTVVLVRNVTDTQAPVGTAPVFDAFNLDGTAYTGALSALTNCDKDDDQIELVPLKGCKAGIDIVGVAIVSDSAAPTVLSEMWRDTDGTWGVLPAGATVGACVVTVAPPTVEKIVVPLDVTGSVLGYAMREVRTFNPDGSLASVVYRDTVTNAVVALPAGTYELVESLGFDTELMPMCDNGVPFLRRFAFNPGGRPSAFASPVDTALDGVTPYVVTGTVTQGACPPQTLVMNPVHFTGTGGNAGGVYTAYVFAQYPDISLEFPLVTNVSDLYLHAMGTAWAGVLGTDANPITNPTGPVLWANAQPAVDAIMATNGYPAGSVLLGDDGAGQPIVWVDANQLSAFDFDWWMGPNIPDSYTNKAKLDTPVITPLPVPSGGCTEGKAWYDTTTGALVKVTDLFGVTVPTPTVMSEGACPAPVAVAPKIKIYLERNLGVLTVADILTITGAKHLHSITVKQYSGEGTLTADNGSPVPLAEKEIWSWSVISQGQVESLDGSVLSMDAGSGEQRITAIYSI